MPREHLLSEVGKRRNALGYKELIELKHVYRVSATALLVRLWQLNVIGKSILTYGYRCEDSMLLVGDRGFRALTEIDRMEDHGIIGAIDQIHNVGLAQTKVLLGVILDSAQVPSVRLPAVTPRRELGDTSRRSSKHFKTKSP